MNLSPNQLSQTPTPHCAQEITSAEQSWKSKEGIGKQSSALHDLHIALPASRVERRRGLRQAAQPLPEGRPRVPAAEPEILAEQRLLVLPGAISPELCHPLQQPAPQLGEHWRVIGSLQRAQGTHAASVVQRAHNGLTLGKTHPTVEPLTEEII